MSYTIKSGDTLGGIATKMNTTVAKLMELNSKAITNKNKIFAGQTLRVRADPPKPPTMAAQVAGSQSSQPSFLDRLSSSVSTIFNPKTESKSKPLMSKASYKAPINPRTKAIQSGGPTLAPQESIGLMARSQQISKAERPQPITTVPNSKALTTERKPDARSYYGSQLGNYDILSLPLQGARKALEAVGANIDPLVVLLDQAKLSVAERTFGVDSSIAKNLAGDITEKDLSEGVVGAMRNNAIKIFETGEAKITDATIGVARRGDVLDGTAEKVLSFFVDPNKSMSLITGATSRGGITLDENNNMILNDVYDFPDYDESEIEKSKSPIYRAVHNLFEPRGTTGEEGFTSGLFEVSPQNTRMMRINLGPAPQKLIAAIQNAPRFIASR